MKATWVHEYEYSALYESAEWQDKLSGPRALSNGLLIAGLVLVAFCAWIYQRFF